MHCLGSLPLPAILCPCQQPWSRWAAITARIAAHLDHHWSPAWNLCTVLVKRFQAGDHRRWQQGGSLIVWLQSGWCADRSSSLKSCCMSSDFRCDFECLSKCTLWKGRTYITAMNFSISPSKTQLLFNCFGELGFYPDRIMPGPL